MKKGSENILNRQGATICSQLAKEILPAPLPWSKFLAAFLQPIEMNIAVFKLNTQFFSWQAGINEVDIV
jgi:hypothetical protein